MKRATILLVVAWTSVVRAQTPPPPTTTPMLVDRRAQLDACLAIDTTPGAPTLPEPTSNQLATPIPWSEFSVDGDLVDDGVCGLLIAEKLGVSQPTVSEHMRILTQAGLVSAKRIKQWTFYRRDETRLGALRAAIGERL